jgi:hypothetical protein
MSLSRLRAIRAIRPSSDARPPTIKRAARRASAEVTGECADARSEVGIGGTVAANSRKRSAADFLEGIDQLTQAVDGCLLERQWYQLDRMVPTAWTTLSGTERQVPFDQARYLKCRENYADGLKLCSASRDQPEHQWRDQLISAPSGIDLEVVQPIILAPLEDDRAPQPAGPDRDGFVFRKDDEGIVHVGNDLGPVPREMDIALSPCARPSRIDGLRALQRGRGYANHTEPRHSPARVQEAREAWRMSAHRLRWYR